MSMISNPTPTIDAARFEFKWVSVGRQLTQIDLNFTIAPHFKRKFVKYSEQGNRSNIDSYPKYCPK
jgi:hypothetical protein